MHLKVLEVRKDPPPVYDHHVPVLIASVGSPRPGRPRRAAASKGSENIQSQEHLDLDDEEPFEVDMEADWDLTTRQVCTYRYNITYRQQLTSVNTIRFFLNYYYTLGIQVFFL